MAYSAQPPRSDEISHEVAIDAIATLGEASVTALLEGPSPLDSWSADSKQRVLELAGLRTTSVELVKAQFPHLLGRPTVKNTPPSPFDSPELQESYEHHSGTLPVLITAPHNGWRKTLGDRTLPPIPHSKASDGATRFIAQDIHHFLGARDLPTPTVLIDAVHRRHRTPQTRASFEYKTYEALCTLRQQHIGPIVHLDLHGFSPHASTADYDLILGTAHRQTVGNTNADVQLANFAASHGYRTYVPKSEPAPGEVFSARSPATLVQRVASLALGQTGSIQIEISSNFRTAETREAGQQLAHDLGTFCLKWAQHAPI
jgi:hypothetical protein